jgi:hypothetical protein
LGMSRLSWSLQPRPLLITLCCLVSRNQLKTSPRPRLSHGKRKSAGDRDSKVQFPASKPTASLSNHRTGERSAGGILRLSKRTRAHQNGLGDPLTRGTRRLKATTKGVNRSCRRFLRGKPRLF